MSTFYEQIVKTTLHSIHEYSSLNAMCINEVYYTYEQLGKCISKVRKALSMFESTNKLVGLVTNDDLETYASIYALWFEGKAFVPLHPLWPIDRCNDILRQIDADLILDSSAETRYADYKVISTPTLPEVDTFDRVEESISDEEAAYVLFTSGTTGRPKGVPITRGNIGAFLLHFWATDICVDHTDRCLQAFDLTFDFSIWSYIVPFSRGACCYTIPEGEIKYVYAATLIEDYHLTFAPLAPSMLRYLRPYFGEIDATSLRVCIFSAEACPIDLMEDFYQIAPDVVLYNFHGATETTISDTWYKIQREGVNKTYNGYVSMGQPLPGIICKIVDESGNEVAPNEKGELCFAGDQITLGYLNDPEKNEQAFRNILCDGKMTRFYRTGDLCLADQDGDLMYCGRIDHQAKIQGFRVEMGEIEYHTKRFLENANVVCMPFEGKDQLTQIAMFIEASGVEEDALFTYLRSKMPEYMMPSRVVCVKCFKLTRNGKIDKKYLLTCLD